MTKEGKEIIAHLYQHYGTGRYVKINDLLIKQGLTELENKDLLVGLEKTGYIVNHENNEKLGNSEGRGQLHDLYTTQILTMLTADGYKYHESQLDRKLQADTTESVLKTNQHQQYNMWLTFGVACLTLLIAFLQFCDDNNDYMRLQSQLHSQELKLDTLDKTVSSTSKHYQSSDSLLQSISLHLKHATLPDSTNLPKPK